MAEKQWTPSNVLTTEPAGPLWVRLKQAYCIHEAERKLCDNIIKIREGRRRQRHDRASSMRTMSPARCDAMTVNVSDVVKETVSVLEEMAPIMRLIEDTPDAMAAIDIETRTAIKRALLRYFALQAKIGE